MTYIPELLWPVNDKRISQGFGARPEVYAQFGMKGHNAIDLTVVSNTPVYASLSGVIRTIANHPDGYGLHIKIAHEMGDETVYAHLASVSVKEGQFVYTGQQIGYSDNTGFSSGPHLHFGYRPPQYNQNNGYFGYIDPKPFLTITPNEYQTMLDDIKKQLDELQRTAIKKQDILFLTQPGPGEVAGTYWFIKRRDTDPKETRHLIETDGSKGAQAALMIVSKPVSYQYLIERKKGKPFPSTDY